MTEPHFATNCCVLQERGQWKMWYLSCTEWIMFEDKPRHRYHIKYAELDDGIHWRSDGHVAIDYASEDEYAISRPCAICDKDVWRMWYSHRGEYYRIVMPEMEDGKNWTRLDHLAGLSRSSTGWDSEMIEYPYVFDHRGQRYLLYNGNGYGRSGFGLAVLET